MKKIKLAFYEYILDVILNDRATCLTGEQCHQLIGIISTIHHEKKKLKAHYSHL